MAAEFTCDFCGKKLKTDGGFHFIYPDHALACETCAENTCFCCDDCGHYWRPQYRTIFDDSDWLCPDCLGLTRKELEAWMGNLTEM